MYHKWVVKEKYSTNSTPVLLNKWWDTDRYIDVGYIDSPEYLTTIPKEGTYYVTINKNTGKIDWIYEFDNTSNSWIKYSPSINADGTVKKNFNSFTVTLTADKSSKNTITVNKPNEYSSSTNKVTKKEFSDNIAVTLTVTPTEGYSVDYWLRGDTKITNTNCGLVTITDYINEETVYTVVFKKSSQEFVQEITVDPEVELEEIANGLKFTLSDSLESELKTEIVENKIICTLTVDGSIDKDTTIELNLKNYDCTWVVGDVPIDDNPAEVNFNSFIDSKGIIIVLKQ